MFTKEKSVEAIENTRANPHQPHIREMQAEHAHTRAHHGAWSKRNNTRDRSYVQGSRKPRTLWHTDPHATMLWIWLLLCGRSRIESSFTHSKASLSAVVCVNPQRMRCRGIRCLFLFFRSRRATALHHDARLASFMHAAHARDEQHQ